VVQSPGCESPDTVGPRGHPSRRSQGQRRRVGAAGGASPCQPVSQPSTVGSAAHCPFDHRFSRQSTRHLVRSGGIRTFAAISGRSIFQSLVSTCTARDELLRVAPWANRVSPLKDHRRCARDSLRDKSLLWCGPFAVCSHKPQLCSGSLPLSSSPSHLPHHGRIQKPRARQHPRGSVRLHQADA
jgi:hypothetical protein